jgi:hypothetical protein
MGEEYIENSAFCPNTIHGCRMDGVSTNSLKRRAYGVGKKKRKKKKCSLISKVCPHGFLVD